jgi:hypothetical protein
MQAACSMGGKRRNFATSLSGAKRGRQYVFHRSGAGWALQAVPNRACLLRKRAQGSVARTTSPLLSSREDSHLGKRQLGWDSPRKGRVA